jgi:hypothetical protein
MFDIKISRFYLVTCVKISHLKRSRSLFFNRVIGNAHGGGIIDMDWGGRLRVAHFGQGESDDSSFFYVHAQGP